MAPNNINYCTQTAPKPKKKKRSTPKKKKKQTKKRMVFEPHTKKKLFLGFLVQGKTPCKALGSDLHVILYVKFRFFLVLMFRGGFWFWGWKNFFSPFSFSFSFSFFSFVESSLPSLCERKRKSWRGGKENQEI